MLDLPFSAWIIFLMFFGAAERAQQARHIEAARAIEPGMEQEEVLAIMGPPDVAYRHWPHWLYGMSVDMRAIAVPGLPCLNPFPFPLRIFSYEDEDVVVRWRQDGRVGTVDLPPPMDVPREFHDILDAGRFVTSVVDLLHRD